ncbi:hypothetical protein Mth01_23230 [Sphaerimonospora thailandensis]|uniref:Uncharacterized protein n=1 Tax=Sphaerimonospora thailandensis TaxID=795644 RepID=A0A8J3VZG6_9ACTN|nr:hypothetical protein Mth01_23230 [Sphaerimonospora thailandensis]
MEDHSVESYGGADEVDVAEGLGEVAELTSEAGAVVVPGSPACDLYRCRSTPADYCQGKGERTRFCDMGWYLRRLVPILETLGLSEIETRDLF